MEAGTPRLGGRARQDRRSSRSGAWSDRRPRDPRSRAALHRWADSATVRLAPAPTPPERSATGRTRYPVPWPQRELNVHVASPFSGHESLGHLAAACQDPHLPKDQSSVGEGATARTRLYGRIRCRGFEIGRGSAQTATVIYERTAAMAPKDAERDFLTGRRPSFSRAGRRSREPRVSR